MSTDNPCITSGHSCGSATNFPQFIDTASCLCGLIPSPGPNPNGEQIQVWRCIGDASGNVASGTDGKWFNTSLPSQELSGLAQPQDSRQNPPDTSQAYVLEDSHGKASYQKVTSSSSSGLTGNDKSCTGKNSTSLSKEYYDKHTHSDHEDHDNHDDHEQHDSSSSTASSSTSSAKSSTVSSITTSTLPSTTASATASSGTTTKSSSSSLASTSPSTLSSTPSSPSPSSSSGSSSDASHINLTIVVLIGMLLAPLIAAIP